MNVSEISPANIINESPVIAAGLIAASAASIILPRVSAKQSIQTASKIIAISVIVILIFMMWFYRHPVDTIRHDTAPGDITSPSYGTVYEILPLTKEIQTDSSFTETHAATSPVQYTHVSIFLSPADVHVQYIPTESRFVKTIYDATGKFELAYEMNKSNENEKAITEILPVPVTINDSAKGTAHAITIPPIFITQIAGFLVRRINTKKFVPGELLNTGQELGMIKFGSRVDIEIPSDFYDLHIVKGQYLYGPKTKIATLKKDLSGDNAPQQQ
jgi:phosphatidylserine decarboxylase